MSDVSGSTTYGYDTRNRLTSKQTPFGALSYTYDNAGDVATITSSPTACRWIATFYSHSIGFRWRGSSGLAALVESWRVTNYGYDAVGNLSGYTYPNGVQTGYNYGALNRLTQVGSTKSGALSNYTYTLGAAGNRLSVAELSGRNVAYGYDSLYRLKSQNKRRSAQPYRRMKATCDSVGDRQQWLSRSAVNTRRLRSRDLSGQRTITMRTETPCSRSESRTVTTSRIIWCRRAQCCSSTTAMEIVP